MIETHKSGDIYQIRDTKLVFLTADPVAGITSEDLLEVLIDRQLELEKRLPCNEDKIILSCLREALHMFDLRRQKRVAQMVYETDIPHRS